MKTRIHYPIIPILLLLALIPGACKKEAMPVLVPESGVLLKFTNECGVPLVDLSVGGKSIGTLAESESTPYLFYESLHFDSGMVDEPAEGMVNGKKAESISKFFWCGTEKSKVEEGVFELNISLLEYERDHYLQFTLK